jgi:dihydroxyacid dehydratase/phosphogluconate dehydratase
MPPIGRIVDERCIVKAMAALLATGGSTNHLIHWVAVARAAGIVIDWDDFDRLSDVVPLLARVYPNGTADVNAFQQAGGPGYVIRELLDAGLMHEDVLTVREGGLREYTRIPGWAEGTHRPAVARRRRQRRRHHPASCRQALQPHRRAQAAHGQPGPLRDQGVGRAGGPARDRGAGAHLRQPGGVAGGVQGWRAGSRRGLRRALAGPAGQRHARTAQS